MLYFKLPFRPLFYKLNFLFGYNILCGLCAVCLVVLINCLNGKEILPTKIGGLIIFTVAVIFSYLGTNYNILQFIFSWLWS